MENQNAVIVPAKKQVTLKDAAKYGIATVATTFALSAYAGELDAVGKAVGDEINASKTIMIALFTTAAVILGILAGWKYLKRGVSSA